jgi:hypothetical protein
MLRTTVLACLREHSAGHRAFGWPTIQTVTQAPRPGCPRQAGTLSAISGMRSLALKY